MDVNIKKNVINIVLDLLIMKYIFNEYSNLHYLHLKVKDVFETFKNLSIKELEINPFYCVSLLGYTWQCGLKYTDIKLQTLQDKETILLLENNIRRISSVMGNRYVKSDGKKAIICR